ncbi:hypothetical protein PAMP_003073 [Pampus punctatissimus]
MAALRALLILTTASSLGHQTNAKNNTPCQLSRWNNGFNTFVKRHIRSGTPNSLDQNEWERYIKEHGGCNRPTQSFLHPDELNKVKAVCTSRGGKVYKDNLCISQQPFTFITVRSEPGTCMIRNVHQETKYLILACEMLDNQCLPVHFEGNPDNIKPSKKDKGCQDPNSQGHAPSFKMTWLWLLSFLLVIIYSY